MNKPELHETVGLNDLNEIARRLRALARRYEDFFKLQFQRLEKHMRLQQEMISQADVVRRLMDDVQQEKQQWESDRVGELERISQASEKLMRAWNELENQQRQLLTAQDGNQADATPHFDRPLNPPSPSSQEIPLMGHTQVLPSQNAAHQASASPVPPKSSSDAMNRASHSNSQQPSQNSGSYGGLANDPDRQQYASPHAVNSVMNNGNTPTAAPANTAVAPNRSPQQQSPELAQFEYEQLKRQMRQHANRQG